MSDTNQRFPWFSALKSAYDFLDTCLAAEVVKDGRSLACKSGCDACCTQPIPMSSAEVMGVRIFLGLQTEVRSVAYDGTPRPCPFLVNGACSIYPVRPFACRRYLVYGAPCARHEDPTETRPGDVHQPSRHALLHALRMTAPYYYHFGLLEAPALPNMDFFVGHTTLLQRIDWDRG